MISGFNGQLQHGFLTGLATDFLTFQAGQYKLDMRYLVLLLYRPYFVKTGKPTKYKLQEKQEGGSVLHVTNASRGRISLTYFGYS